MEADITEVTFEFSVLLAVQNLLGCGRELKPSPELFLVGCYKDNEDSAAHLSRMTLHVNFLFLREKTQSGTPEGGRNILPLRMQLENT